MSVITIVIAVVVLLIVAAVYVAVRGRGFRGPRLSDLNEDARRRYAVQWRVIETRFIDHPQEAVREADQLAVRILSDRGAEMHHERAMPRQLRDARRVAQRDRTDQLHRAMQHYQAIVDDACGRNLREDAEQGKLEIA